jgi:hypothetical protein
LRITCGQRIIRLMTDAFGGLLDSVTLALDAEGKSPKTVEN